MIFATRNSQDLWVLGKHNFVDVVRIVDVLLVEPQPASVFFPEGQQLIVAEYESEIVTTLSRRKLGNEFLWVIV